MALTESLNKFRMENRSKTFTREELIESLYKMGFNRGVAGMIISKFIPAEKMGTSKLYSFGTDPIHNKAIEAIYRKFASYGTDSKKQPAQLPNEESLINKVKEMGYQIRKCVGFDMERFKKEQPFMYQKYLRYESV